MSPNQPRPSLPHHKLVAYQLALQLVQLVARTRIGDARLREQARKSASSAALNTAEGAARQSRADKSRMYGIALAEACEACAAVEIAAPWVRARLATSRPSSRSGAESKTS
jgi:hypothetical protein